MAFRQQPIPAATEGLQARLAGRTPPRGGVPVHSSDSSLVQSNSRHSWPAIAGPASASARERRSGAVEPAEFGPLDLANGHRGPRQRCGRIEPLPRKRADTMRGGRSPGLSRGGHPALQARGEPLCPEFARQPGHDCPAPDRSGLTRRREFKDDPALPVYAAMVLGAEEATVKLGEPSVALKCTDALDVCDRHRVASHPGIPGGKVVFRYSLPRCLATRVSHPKEAPTMQLVLDAPGVSIDRSSPAERYDWTMTPDTASFSSDFQCRLFMDYIWSEGG